jgi:hypothetical protein
VRPEEQNTLLLRTIQQKHERWKYDREFAKIVTKMEKGKNLKKKEFDKIHWFIWNIGH